MRRTFPLIAALGFVAVVALAGCSKNQSPSTVMAQGATPSFQGTWTIQVYRNISGSFGYSVGTMTLQSSGNILGGQLNSTWMSSGTLTQCQAMLSGSITYPKIVGPGQLTLDVTPAFVGTCSAE